MPSLELSPATVRAKRIEIRKGNHHNGSLPITDEPNSR